MEAENSINLKEKKEEVGNLKLYEDYKSFQGITFENNINSTNSLLFGQGLKISDTPFIIKEENSGKNFLAVNKIHIKSDIVDKTICYPKRCVNIVFYHENCIFYLGENNTLEMYKLKQNNVEKFLIPNNKIKNLNIKKDVNFKAYNLSEIFQAVNNIKDQNSVLVNYEILVNILNNNFKLKQKQDKINPNKKTEDLIFDFPLNDFHCSIEINKIEIEIDGVGMIREKLNVKKGEISLIEGINSINEYVKLKKENNKKYEEYIYNSFKCPILYKNFENDTIPENNTLLMEIKSGIDLSGLESQIKIRIDLIKECLFKPGEKPSFFIGLINLDSNNVEGLTQFMNMNLTFKEKTLIICCIDYEYCGTDLSYEINNDYLLYKEMKKLETKIDKYKEDLETKMDKNKEDLETKIDKTKGDLEAKINLKFDSLIMALQQHIPGIMINYQEVLKNKNKEEKKDSN